MSAVSMNEAAKKTAQLENAKEARPPGGAPQEEHLVDDDHTVSRYPAFDLQKEILSDVFLRKPADLLWFREETVLWGTSTEGRMGGLVVLLDKSIQTAPQLFQ